MSSAGNDGGIISRRQHPQRPPAPPLHEIAKARTTRDEAIVAAYASGEYSYHQIATYFGLHFKTVGKIVRRQ